MEKLFKTYVAAFLLLSYQAYGKDVKTEIIQKRLQLEDTLTLGDRSYHLLFAGPFTHEDPWICFSAHEGVPAILFEPENSPVLEKAVRKCQEQLQERELKNLQKILAFCMDFVTRKLFSEKKQTIEAMLGVAPTMYHEGIGLVPLDAYAKEGAGMCKQLSLAYLYLIGRILPESRLTFHRGTILLKGTWISHAWAEIGIGNKTYLVDPGLGLIFDHDKDQEKILKIYGTIS